MTRTDAIRVLVCEDAESQMRVFETEIADDTGAGGRPIVAAGQVARSAGEVVSRAGRGAEVVLVDLMLPSGPGLTDIEPRAVQVAARIRKDLADRRPRLILWTTAPDPSEALAFVAAGGHHVIDKSQPVAAIRRTIRETAAGACWGPRQPAATLTKSGTPLAGVRLLPYLEAGWAYKDVAAELHVTVGAVDKARRGLADALGVLRSEGNAALVQAARGVGQSWIPLRYREYVGPGGP